MSSDDNPFTTSSNRLPAYLLAGILCLGSTTAWASAEVCREPVKYTELSIGAINHDTSGLEPGPGRTRRQDRNLDILVRRDSSGLSFGFGHRYVMFNFEAIAPQTNGHLHTSLFPLHWSNESGGFRISIAPALSASSNVMGHPPKYRSDTLQALVGLAWRRRLSENAVARFAMCGDHSFGEFRAYPSVGIEWRPGPAWIFDLGYPRSRIGYRISARWSTSLSAAPDGNEWHVTDRAFRDESQLVYKAYALDWRVSWRVSPQLALGAGVGSSLDGRYDLSLSSGERVRLTSEPALRVGVDVRWRF